MSFFTPDQLTELDANWIRRDGTNTAIGEILFEDGLKTAQILDDGLGTINIQATGSVMVQSPDTTVEGSNSTTINTEGILLLKGDTKIKNDSPSVEFPTEIHLINNDQKNLTLTSQEVTDDRTQKFSDSYGTIPVV